MGMALPHAKNLLAKFRLHRMKPRKQAAGGVIKKSTNNGRPLDKPTYYQQVDKLKTIKVHLLTKPQERMTWKSSATAASTLRAALTVGHNVPIHRTML